MDLCFREDVPFFWCGRGALLVPRDDMLRLIPEIAAAGAQVLGFEGFEIGSDGVLPRLDLIIDPDRWAGPPGTLPTIAGWPEGVWVDVALRLPCV